MAVARVQAGSPQQVLVPGGTASINCQQLTTVLLQIDFNVGRLLPHALTRQQPTADSDDEGGSDGDGEDGGSGGEGEGREGPALDQVRAPGKGRGGRPRGGGRSRPEDGTDLPGGTAAHRRLHGLSCMHAAGAGGGGGGGGGPGGGLQKEGWGFGRAATGICRQARTCLARLAPPCPHASSRTEASAHGPLPQHRCTTHVARRTPESSMCTRAAEATRAAGFMRCTASADQALRARAGG